MGAMWTNADRAFRALRLRRGWTQERLGAHARVSREMVSRVERGALRGMTVTSIERIAEALGASLSLTIRWQGEQLDRLIDSAHASLQQMTAAMLLSLGWLVQVEVSFNEFGERGRIDLLAYHPRLRILLVIEVKSAVGNVQETLGILDVKLRLARRIAHRLGWTDVATVVPALVIGDSRPARRVVAEHDALFGRFAVRGRAALAWLRTASEPAPLGLLWFADVQDSHGVTNVRGKRARNRSRSHEP
jgi:transcriptional regulator with XRE-family HTH domain